MQRSSATGQRAVGHTKAFKTGLLRGHKNINKFATGAHPSITPFLGVWVSTSLWKDNISPSFPCPSAFRAWCMWAGGHCQCHCNACLFSCEVFKSSEFNCSEYRAVTPTANPLLHCMPSEPLPRQVPPWSHQQRGGYRHGPGQQRINLPVAHEKAKPAIHTVA